MPKHLCCCVVVLLTFTSQCFALDVLQAYQRAANRDPKLTAALAKFQAAQLEQDKAQSGYFPKVELTLSQGIGHTVAETGNTFTSGTSRYNTQNYGLYIRQPIINFGLSQDVAKATAMSDASELDYQFEQNNLYSRLLERYCAVLLAQDSFGTYSKRLTSLNKQLAQAEYRFKVGVGVRDDMNDLNAEIAMTQAKIVDAKAALLSSRNNLKSLILIQPDGLLQFDSYKIEKTALDSRSLEEWVQIARLENPELQRALQEVKASESEYKKQKANYFPTVDFVASKVKSQSDTNNTIGSKYDTTLVSLQLRMPLYGGGYTQSSVKQSAINMEAAKALVDVKSVEINEKISQEYNSLIRSYHLIKANILAKQAYEESSIGAQQAFLAGTRTLADVLKNQNQVDETTLRLKQETYSYLISLIRLKELTGEVSIGDILYLSDFHGTYDNSFPPSVIQPDE